MYIAVPLNPLNTDKRTAGRGKEESYAFTIIWFNIVGSMAPLRNCNKTQTLKTDIMKQKYCLNDTYACKLFVKFICR